MMISINRLFLVGNSQISLASFTQDKFERKHNTTVAVDAGSAFESRWKN